MSKLTIADLSATHDLDRREMSAVHGGWVGMPFYYPAPSVKVNTTNFTADQLIGQTNTIMNNTGNDVAFVKNIHSTVDPTQQAHNVINF